MSRHITDRPSATQPSKLAEAFVEIERKTKPAEASKALQKRPHLTGNGRLREFLRIERGARA